jgi:hypothetical protein
MQPDEVPAAREAEQGHEGLSWVVSHLSQIESHRLFSPKQTLTNSSPVAIFGQFRTLGIESIICYQVKILIILLLGV